MSLTKDKNYYDFEQLYFEKNCDIDKIITTFFSKHDDVIKGDIEYIIYKIKKTIKNDRKILTEINGDGKDILNRIGKSSLIKHHVIPENNNNKEYYMYLINTFI